MNEKITEIVDNVSKLYLEYGIRGVTMDDVAHRLSISKKTLYEYFNDKEQLVWAVLDHVKNEWDNRFAANMCDNCSAIDELFYFYEIQVKMIKNNKPAFVYDLKKYYPEVYKHYQNLKQEMIVDHFLGNLNKGQKEGYYRKDMDNEIISKLNLMRIEGIMNNEYFTIEDLLNTELFTEIFKYHLYGIVSEKGRKIIEQKFSNIDN
jgi:TetR/AcrR family transcriptional regulator, cholesterol catabolism regulator